MKPLLPEAPASVFPLIFVQFFMLFFLFLALLYGVGELTLFSLIILSVSVGSHLWSRFSLNHLQCDIHFNRSRLFPGEKLKIEIRAVNAKWLPVLFGIDLFVPGSLTGTPAGDWISDKSGLLWYQQSVFSSEWRPKKRGVFDLGPPTLRGGDLFGFSFRRRTAVEQHEIVVYPRIVGIRPMPIPKKEFFGVPGASSPVEDPIYVFGTRDYQPGRPARGIHWKASARHHRLQEKLCEPAEQEKVLILLDVDQFDNRGADEDFEKCLEVIASLVLQMDTRRIAVGFATNAHIHGGKPNIIPVSRSPMQIQVIFETLARAKMVREPGPVTDIISKGYRIPWGVSCLYFACQQSEKTRSAGTFLKNRHIPVRFIASERSSEVEIPRITAEENLWYLQHIVAEEK